MDTDIKTPSLEKEDEYTVIEGQKVKIVRIPEMKDEPDPTVHHHNDLDQPSIDINRDIIGVLNHTDLAGVTADQHHAQLHAASHTSGGGDDLAGITLTNIILSGGRMTGGTVNTSTIGTPTITGGTATNLTLITPTIGTPSLTGGTLNPVAYQAGGTAGVDGTAVYVKTIVGGTADTWGTIVITKGIVTSVS